MNWINDVVEQAQREVKSWPMWMQRQPRENCICIPACSFETTAECNCGESLEAASSLTCAQHSEKCAITIEYQNKKKCLTRIVEEI